MTDFPNPNAFGLDPSDVLSASNQLMGLITGADPTSVAWPLTNKAIFVPIRVAFPVTVYKLVIGAGATVAGNFDIGIYDASGNRLVSSGSTAKGASVAHVLDVTDTVIGPGVYYLAMSANGTNNYIAWAPSVQIAKLMGLFEMATAFPLPATATFATATHAFLPTIGAYLRRQ